MGYEATFRPGSAQVGAWNQANEILYEGGAAAWTNVPNDDLDVWGFDFASAIPSSGAEIRGISVRADAWKEELSDASVLRLRFYFSWDGGTSWTTATRYLPALGFGESNEQSFVVGGPTDLWGRSWSLAEVRSASNFRLRVRSSPKFQVDVPEYHCRWAAVTVYWEKTGQIDRASSERIEITERVETSITHYVARERIGIHDRGSSSPNEVKPLVENYALSGTAMEALETSSTFSDESDTFRRAEGMGLRLVFGTTGPVFWIGDANLSPLKNSGSIADNMQAGLVSVGEIRYSGNFGQAQTPANCTLTLANRLYVDQSSPANTTPKSLLEHAQGKPWVGNHVTVWAFVNGGGGWKQRTIFDGIIESVEFGESEVTVGAVQVGRGSVRVPDIYVTEESFTYNAGVGDTGEQPDGAMGKVVPFGIGRFDVTALDRETDLESGHYLKRTDVAGDDLKRYSAAAILPAMFGVKFPMLPTALAAQKWRRVATDSGGEDDFKSYPFQNVFLFGSRKSVPNLTLQIDQLSSTQTSRFPGAEWTVSKNQNRTLWHRNIFTWQQLGGGRGVAVPFSQEYDTRCGVTAGKDRIQAHQGAGSMDELGYPSIEPGVWSDGDATDAFGIFVNHYLPKYFISSYLERLAPTLQTVAIPLQGITKLSTTVLWEQLDEAIQLSKTWPRYSPSFSTTELSGAVEKPLNALDLANLNSKTRVNNGYSYCAQFPESFQALGKIHHVRICIAWNSNSTTNRFFLIWRMGGVENRGIVPHAARGADWHEDLNTEWRDDLMFSGPGSASPTLKLAAMNVENPIDPSPWANPFASALLLPYWDHIADVEFEQVDATRDSIFRARNYYDDGTLRPTPVLYLTPKRSSDWEFRSWDWATSSKSAFLSWPWDVMVKIDSGGGYLDIYALWAEVTYTSSFASQRFSPDQLVAERGKTYRTNNRGEQEIAYPGSQASDLENARVLAGRFLRDDPEARTNSAVYVTGRGLVDTTGKYTGSLGGTSGRIVENPADIAGVIIHHFLGSTAFDIRAGGALNPDTFGSFVKARTLLTSSSRMSYFCDKPTTMSQVLADISQDARAFIQEQMDENGNLRYRMFVDDTNPATNDPGRLYRSGSYYFNWDRIVSGSFRAELTPLGDISNNVRLRYGWHIPSGTFAKEYYCSRSGCNFKTSASTYKVAAGASFDLYKTENPIVVDAPYIWDDSSADALAKYYFDIFRRRRAVVEFETYVNGIDLAPGHVIRFDDEIGDRTDWPDSGSTAWSSHQFNVIQVGIRRDEGGPVRVHVRAVETYQKAI